jgi:hypothetical protein
MKSATMEATSSVEAAATVTAMSRRDSRPNQADRRQCEQCQYQFPRHASLHSVRSPTKRRNTAAPGLFGDEKFLR